MSNNYRLSCYDKSIISKCLCIVMPIIIECPFSLIHILHGLYQLILCYFKQVGPWIYFTYSWIVINSSVNAGFKYEQLFVFDCQDTHLFYVRLIHLWSFILTVLSRWGAHVKLALDRIVLSLQFFWKSFLARKSYEEFFSIEKAFFSWAKVLKMALVWKIIFYFAIWIK